MNLQPEEIPACAAAYLRIVLGAIEHGAKLDPGDIETTLCEDNQSVLLMFAVPGETLVDGFKLEKPTTEEEFYA